MNSPSLLYSIIINQSKNRPQASAILSPDKIALSYHLLSRHIYSTALYLTRLGIRPVDRVAVVLPNGPEMATTFLAISSVCTCAPLNPSYRLEEFKLSMENLHIKALVTLPGNDSPACKAAESLGIPVIDLKPDDRMAGIFSLTSDLPIDETISEPILAGVENVALVLQTSGTTSHPKIVPLTHRNIFYSVNNISRAYVLTPEDRCLNMMPLFHIHGLMAAVAASLASGGSVVCARGYIPDQVLGWLSGLAPTWYTAVPTMHQAILEQIRRQPEAARQMKLRFIRSCSSALAPHLAQDLETTLRAPVLEAYGMTEAAHQIAGNPLPPRTHKFGSVGLSTGTTRISIRDVKGKVLPTGAIGEICIRGENVMVGYENNPVANATNFTGGWLRTGDLGFLDEDGYLFIQGRLKELINRGGEKISPREIDDVILRHPAVKQAVAFAVPHPSLGEDVAAAIVLREGQKVSTQELRQYAAANLADFKVPRQIVFVQEIPKGPTGKIQRIGLAEKLRTELDDFLTRETAGLFEPRTPLETELLSIWQRVLDMKQVGIQDDFLAMGGDSIKAARILMLVNDRFKVNLSLDEIFVAPSIALMADIILERQNKKHQRV